MHRLIFTMAIVKRSSVIENYQKLTGLNIATDGMPQTLGSSINPSIEIGPKFTFIVRSISGTSTGAITAYTTPTDKDFYLTFLHESFTKDATCDMVDFRTNITTEGVSRNISSIPSQTTTAESRSQNTTFSYPIKLDRGSTIQTLGAFTAGTCTKKLNIGGFILE